MADEELDPTSRRSAGLGNHNVDTHAVRRTGTNPACISRFGANDMVGNLWEWVADWDEESDGCATNTFGSDATCFGDAGTPTRVPAMLTRGGFYGAGTRAGPFAADAGVQGRIARLGQGFREPAGLEVQRAEVEPAPDQGCLNGGRIRVLRGQSLQDLHGLA